MLEGGWTWSAIAGLIATAAVAFWVYKLQKRHDHERNEKDDDWQKSMGTGVSALEDATRKVDSEVTALSEVAQQIREELGDLRNLVEQQAKQNAEAELQRIEADSQDSTDDDPADTERPRDQAAYLQALEESGVSLNYNNLRWAKKVRGTGEQRGNLGWFVDDGDKRYFIHRGRTTTVRPAIPNALLTAWSDETGKDPRQIRLDYRTNDGPGNHSWFVTTYDDQTWRISMGGREKTSPTISRLDS